MWILYLVFIGVIIFRFVVFIWIDFIGDVFVIVIFDKFVKVWVVF